MGREGYILKVGRAGDKNIIILAGYDFWGDDEDPSDYFGHGTMVANVIAEATDNGLGAAGMAPFISILPIKVFPDDEGGAEDSDIIDAINYAVASGAYTVLGEPLPVQGAPGLTKFLTEDIADIFGGKFAFEGDPIKAARLMIDHIDAQRAALHLPGPMYDVPYTQAVTEPVSSTTGQ